MKVRFPKKEAVSDAVGDLFLCYSTKDKFDILRLSVGTYSEYVMNIVYSSNDPEDHFSGSFDTPSEAVQALKQSYKKVRKIDGYLQITKEGEVL